MASKNKFNYDAIAELSHMANLRNHLMALSQNRNLSTTDEMTQLRNLIGKIDKEIIRRALANDVEKVQAKKPAVKKKVVKKRAVKKTTNA